MLLLSCFVIILLFYFTADRFLHLATFSWRNNHIVTTQLDHMQKTERYDVYAANVSLKIYNGKGMWIIGIPCFCET